MRAGLWLAIVVAVNAPGAPRDRVISSDAPVTSLSFSADGALLAATCGDGQVRHWDARTGELKRKLPLDDKQVDRRDRAFSPDRKLAARAMQSTTNGSEYTVRISDGSGTERLALSAGLGGISKMVFSSDGRTIVAAGFDTNIRAWSTRDGELLRLMDELPLATFAAAFSPDGKYLATGGADRLVYLWDTQTWTIARKLSGQPEMISAIAFSADGRFLLTGGFSEFTEQNPVKVILWNLNSGEPVRSMPSSRMVTTVAFSPDGAHVASANLGKSVSIWDIRQR